MATSDSHSTATAGEHYVAYRIACLGFVPALIRPGCRAVDLLVSSFDGSRTVGVQVKSTSNARREKSKGAVEDTSHLQFPLSQCAIAETADTGIFCFVDLRLRTPNDGPDVYIVPAKALKKEYAGYYGRKHSPFYHQRSAESMEPYRNNWQPLIDGLAGEKNPETTVKSPMESAEPSQEMHGDFLKNWVAVAG